MSKWALGQFKRIISNPKLLAIKSGFKLGDTAVNVIDVMSGLGHAQKWVEPVLAV